MVEVVLLVTANEANDIDHRGYEKFPLGSNSLDCVCSMAGILFILKYLLWPPIVTYTCINIISTIFFLFFLYIFLQVKFP